MNSLIKAASSSIELGGLLGVMTAVFLIVFLGWIWWAYNPKNREKMEQFGRIPFDDEAPLEEGETQ